MSIRFIISLCSLIMIHARLVAQDFSNLRFEQITMKEGLSSNAATCVVQDKQGFIWIGTSNGLNRYDGYRFKQYFHDYKDSNSLINNAVQTMHCDSQGRLWICTERGVSCYIPAQNKFINYDTRLTPPFYINNNSSVRIYEDENNTVWLCNERDVIYRVMDDMRLKEVKIKLPVFYEDNIPQQGYDKIFRNNNGEEWAFKLNRIYKIDKQTKQPVRQYVFSALGLSYIQKIIQDKTGNYWVATWGRGLFQFFPDRDSIVQVTTIPQRIYPEIAEWSYKEKNYLATLEINSGLYLLENSGTNHKRVSFISGGTSFLQGNNFSALFFDNQKNLWISSDHGIQLVKPAQNSYDIIPVIDPGTSDLSMLKNSNIYSYFETDSSTWLSKRYLSTFEYDKDFRIKNFYRSLFPISSSETHNNGYGYYFYKNRDELFISTDSGLVVYNLVNKTSAEFFPDGSFPKGLGFRTIIPFTSETILVRTVQYGLFVFNIYTKKFVRNYSNEKDCDDCFPLRLAYLFKSVKGEIFVASEFEKKNLFKYYPVEDRFKPVGPQNDKEYTFQGSDLRGMDEDAEGNLWVVSSTGVFIYNPEKNMIVRELPAEKEMTGLFRICFDNAGNAWVNGISGIWCYVKATGKWISFDNNDGLPGSSFDGIITKNKKGDIVAGLEGAIAVFHPDKIFSNTSSYPAIITEARIENEEFSYTAVSGEKKLNLRPGQNSFSVDFAILNYLSSSATHYYYKLEPVMKDFQLNSNGHINFNGLAPGTYTLHVRGGDKAGNIFSNEDRLIIIAEPFWYQTKFFKAGLILLLIAAVAWLVRRRIKSIRRESQLKQKMAETEMQALRAQMNPHFIFNSLNSIENFIMQNEKRLASDYLNKFARLIRMILDSSRNELVPVAKDMEALQLYIDLEQLRFDNKFRYKASVDSALLHGDYKVPSLLIQPYVENAIVHGLAHSEKKDLSLSVTARLENDHILYLVEDNGVGRAAAGAFNLQNKPQHKSVGLKITEDRVNLFNKNETGNRSIKITDLYNENNEPAGTKVEVIIKIV